MRYSVQWCYYLNFLSLYGYTCSTPLAPSGGRVLKLLFPFWFLQLTKLPIVNFSFVFQKMALQLKFMVSILSIDLCFLSTLPDYWSFLTHMEECTRSQPQSWRRRGFSTQSVGSAHGPSRKIPGYGTPRSSWMDFLLNAIPLMSFLPSPPPINLPRWSQKSCLNTLSAVAEKWVSPVMTHTTEIARQ